MKITDTMVLALLKKGFAYEAKNVDMNMDMEVPLSMITLDDEHANIKLNVNVNCKIEEVVMKVTEDVSEF